MSRWGIPCGSVVKPGEAAESAAEPEPVPELGDAVGGALARFGGRRAQPAGAAVAAPAEEPGEEPEHGYSRNHRDYDDHRNAHDNTVASGSRNNRHRMQQRRDIKAIAWWVLVSAACTVGAIAAASGRNFGATIVLALFVVGSIVMAVRA